MNAKTLTRAARTSDPTFRPASIPVCQAFRSKCMQRARAARDAGDYKSMRKYLLDAWRWHYLAMDKKVRGYL